MIGLFFEVIPLEGHAPRYFELAASLKPEVERSGGLLFIDRYISVDRPEVVLSHQWWADEASLSRWREHSGHRAIQRAGRDKHFRDYRIRIGQALDPSAAAAATRGLWAAYYEAAPAGRVDGELFRSVYREGKFLALADHAPAAPDASDIKAFGITRDYTMHKRAEAPQEYPPVANR